MTMNEPSLAEYIRLVTEYLSGPIRRANSVWHGQKHMDTREIIQYSEMIYVSRLAGTHGAIEIGANSSLTILSFEAKIYRLEGTFCGALQLLHEPNQPVSTPGDLVSELKADAPAIDEVAKIVFGSDALLHEVLILTEAKLSRMYHLSMTNVITRAEYKDAQERMAAQFREEIHWLSKGKTRPYIS